MDNLCLMVNTNIDEPLSFIDETIRVLTPPWIIMIPSPSKSWGTFFTTVRDQKKKRANVLGEKHTHVLNSSLHHIISFICHSCHSFHNNHIYIICRCIQVYPGWYIPQFWWIDDNWPLWKSKDHRTSRPLLEYKPPKPVSSWLATTEWMLLLTRSVAKNRIWQWPMSCRHNVSKDGKELCTKSCQCSKQLLNPGGEV